MEKPRKKPKVEDIKTEPNAWERFENAVDAAVKSGSEASGNAKVTKTED